MSSRFAIIRFQAAVSICACCCGVRSHQRFVLGLPSPVEAQPISLTQIGLAESCATTISWRTLSISVVISFVENP